jgi:hypothetical protein
MSAEIIPFPLHATRTWPYIAEEYIRRHDKTAYGKRVPERRDKAAYAKGVIDNNIERMQRFGVSPELIAAEVREIESYSPDWTK